MGGWTKCRALQGAQCKNRGLVNGARTGTRLISRSGKGRGSKLSQHPASSKTLTGLKCETGENWSSEGWITHRPKREKSLMMELQEMKFWQSWKEREKIRLQRNAKKGDLKKRTCAPKDPRASRKSGETDVTVQGRGKVTDEYLLEIR